ncbi:hypothetical protein CPC08DRAFT_756525 [Agrocybe pediades]|nr:hypothetical protein CPC08DRAFT_756525 [Agrocybe pediades]
MESRSESSDDLLRRASLSTFVNSQLSCQFLFRRLYWNLCGHRFYVPWWGTNERFGAPGGSVQILAGPTTVAIVITILQFFTQNSVTFVIADAVLVWRCFHACGQSLRSSVMPIALFILETVTSLKTRLGIQFPSFLKVPLLTSEAQGTAPTLMVARMVILSPHEDTSASSFSFPTDFLTHPTSHSNGPQPNNSDVGDVETQWNESSKNGQENEDSLISRSSRHT